MEPAKREEIVVKLNEYITDGGNDTLYIEAPTKQERKLAHELAAARGIKSTNLDGGEGVVCIKREGPTFEHPSGRPAVEHGAALRPSSAMGMRTPSPGEFPPVGAAQAASPLSKSAKKREQKKAKEKEAEAAAAAARIDAAQREAEALEQAQLAEVLAASQQTAAAEAAQREAYAAQKSAVEEQLREPSMGVRAAAEASGASAAATNPPPPTDQNNDAGRGNGGRGGRGGRGRGRGRGAA